MDGGRIIACDEPRRVGDFLKKDGNEMFAAMPSPVQIYYGVENELQCPLTVREGRNWLSELFAGRQISSPAIKRAQVRDCLLYTSRCV